MAARHVGSLRRASRRLFIETLEARLALTYTPTSLVLNSSTPHFHSLPTASQKLFLDFDGGNETQWNANVTPTAPYNLTNSVRSPAYDTNGNPLAFSNSEILEIQAIWNYVAEDFAPFNIDVTTEDPLVLGARGSERIAIGGTGGWYNGGAFVATSYFNGWSSLSLADNWGYVFSSQSSFQQTPGPGIDPKRVADQISHVIGFTMGLNHQSLYSGTTLVQQYYDGPGNGRAPIMGSGGNPSTYDTDRSVWWRGTPYQSPLATQDDLAIIASANNGFGYRKDDYGNTAALGTSFNIGPTQVRLNGVISTIYDYDFFRFSTTGGTVNLSVLVRAPYNNLDAALQLRNADGSVILAQADDLTVSSGGQITGYNASLSRRLTAGIYTVAVHSHGTYGDVGQYTLYATLIAQAPSPIPVAPTNLTWYSGSTSQIALAWRDNAFNETGYAVQRSNDGVTGWADILLYGNNTTAATNTGLAAATSYYYRVRAINASVTPSLFSNYSNVVQAFTRTTPPTGLTAKVVPSSPALPTGGVQLDWNDTTGEAGYRIERSTNGTQFNLINTIAAGSVTYTDTTVTAGIGYFYRIVAVNTAGNSGASNVAYLRIAAGSISTGVNAPINVNAYQLSTTYAYINWTGNNRGQETSFIIERAPNGSNSWLQVATVNGTAYFYYDIIGDQAGEIGTSANYQYRIKAVTAGGTSAPSAAVTPQPLP